MDKFFYGFRVAKRGFVTWCSDGDTLEKFVVQMFWKICLLRLPSGSAVAYLNETGSTDSQRIRRLNESLAALKSQQQGRNAHLFH